ncbi:cbb3-type cytochrome oxidase assembly protein CcoS [bacterium]|nr:cbb3-type cytochrome oxidase assembly protein CcoS [bacterium]
MSVLYVLVVVSLSVALGFLVAFVWSVRSGQLDDDRSPSVRMLIDDAEPSKTTENEIL